MNYVSSNNHPVNCCKMYFCIAFYEKRAIVIFFRSTSSGHWENWCATLLPVWRLILKIHLRIEISNRPMYIYFFFDCKKNNIYSHNTHLTKLAPELQTRTIHFECELMRDKSSEQVGDRGGSQDITATVGTLQAIRQRCLCRMGDIKAALNALNCQHYKQQSKGRRLHGADSDFMEAEDGDSVHVHICCT